MRRGMTIGVLFITVLGLSAVSCDDEDESALPDLQGRQITVGTENGYLPFSYVLAETSQAGGWDYDAWEAICELLNCVPIMTEVAWPDVLEMVAAGELDVGADGISITEERRESLDFSDPYLAVEQKFLVRLGDDRYATAQAIIDDTTAMIGAMTGTTNYDLAVELVGESRVTVYDTLSLCIGALLDSDIDAAVIDEVAGLGYFGEGEDQVRLIRDSLRADYLGFIFPPGSDLVDPVNQALSELDRNGTLDTLAQRYFSDEFTLTYDDVLTPGE